MNGLDLKNLLQELEVQGDDPKDIRKLAPLLVYLIQQNKEYHESLTAVLEKLSSIKYPEVDFDETNSLLRKIAAKEVNIPETKFPDIPKADHSDLSLLLAEIATLLRAKTEDPQIIFIKSPESSAKEKSQIQVQQPARAGTWAVSQMLRETPTGTIDGVNTLFYLSRSVKNDAYVFVFQNGVLQEGNGVSYTLSGNQITFNTAPTAGDRLHIRIFLA